MAGVIRDLPHERRDRPSSGTEVSRASLAAAAAELGTWEWDLSSGRVTWDERLEVMYGFAPGTFDGTYEAYQQVLHPEDRSMVQDAIRHALETTSGHHVQHRIVRPDGTIRWIEGWGRVLQDDDGHGDGHGRRRTRRHRSPGDARGAGAGARGHRCRDRAVGAAAIADGVALARGVAGGRGERPRGAGHQGHRRHGGERVDPQRGRRVAQHPGVVRVRLHAARGLGSLAGLGRSPIG